MSDKRMEPLLDWDVVSVRQEDLCPTLSNLDFDGVTPLKPGVRVDPGSLRQLADAVADGWPVEAALQMAAKVAADDPSCVAPLRRALRGRRLGERASREGAAEAYRQTKEQLAQFSKSFERMQGASGNTLATLLIEYVVLQMLNLEAATLLGIDPFNLNDVAPATLKV